MLSINPELDKKYATWVTYAFFLALFGSILALFLRYVVFEHYTVQFALDCDPREETCFVWECDPTIGPNGESECTGDIDEDIFYYNKLHRIAKNVPTCDYESEECDYLSCQPGEKSCSAFTCTPDIADTENGERCNDPSEYNVMYPEGVGYGEPGWGMTKEEYDEAVASGAFDENGELIEEDVETIDLTTSDEQQQEYVELDPFGENAFTTSVEGYLTFRERNIFGEDRTVAYLAITDFKEKAFQTSLRRAIESGNTINALEGDSVLVSLGCFQDAIIIDDEGQNVIDETVEKALLVSSVEKPISVDLSFQPAVGTGCICCALAESIALHLSNEDGLFIR